MGPVCDTGVMPVIPDSVTLLLVRLAVDPTPKPEDVKAGWGALALFVLLGIAIALLGWSMSRHLRRAQSNEADGLFDRDPAPKRSDRGSPEA